MKKLTGLLCFVLLMLFASTVFISEVKANSGSPLMCTPNRQNPRSARYITCNDWANWFASSGGSSSTCDPDDDTLCVDVSLFSTITTSFANTIRGLHTVAAQYGYDGSVFRPQTMRQLNADNVASTIRGLDTASFSYSWNVTGAVWKRLSSTTASDALSATPNALDALSYNLFYDGTNHRRWLGATVDDTMDASPAAPYTASLTSFFDSVQHRRWTGEAIDASMTAAPVAPWVTAGNVFYESTSGEHQYWLGDALNSDTVPNTTEAPFVGGFGHIWNVTGAVWKRTTATTASDALSATPNALDALTYNLFYDGTNYRRWLGATISDAMAAGPVAPFTASHTLFYDGTNHRRWTGDALGDSLGAATVVPFVGSHNLFYDGANYMRWTGSALNSDAVANTTEAPYVGSFTHGWNLTSSAWSRIPILGTQADSLATTTDGVVTSSVLYGYDSVGADFNMLRLGTSNELQVTDVATRPGEDAGNDRRKIFKDATNTYSPAKTAATAVDSTEDVVLASIDLLQYPNCTFYVKNVGGGSGDALANVIVDASPDGTEWIDMDAAKTTIETNTETLASGATGIAFITSNQSIRYWRVSAICAGGDDTTVDAWVTCNVN